MSEGIFQFLSASDVLMHIMTPTTPPQTRDRIHNTRDDAQARKAILDGVRNHRVHPKHGPTNQSPPGSAKDLDLDVELRKLSLVSADAGAAWTSGTGCGAATVTLYRDVGHGSSASPLTVPGVTFTERQAEVKKHSTSATDAPLFVFECDGPQVVLAAAFGILDVYRHFELDATCALVDGVVQCASDLALAVKKKLKVPRLWNQEEFDPAVPATRVYLPVPYYSSYPGGHATVMLAVAGVLCDVMGITSQRATLESLAVAIATRREAAGLHVKSDTDAGVALGTQLADHLIAVAKTGGFPIWSEVYASAAKEWA